MVTQYPEWMGPETAARYLDMRPQTFERKVRDGTIPKPSYEMGGRSPRWRRSDLDAMMRPTSAGADFDRGVQEYVASLEEDRAKKSRPRRSENAG